MESSSFKCVCDSCDSKLASVFCHSDGAFLCPQCDAQVHSVNKLAQRHLRVPCQSCPVWAYREAKSRGRLLDMPLAACLTRNLQLDIFDGSTPCWPSTNKASSVAMGTPQSDTSSPQATAAAPPAAAGSPSSEVYAAAIQHASNSWPQNSALAMTSSQPQPLPQPILNSNSNLMCPGAAEQQQQQQVAATTDAAIRAAQFTLSPFSACSGGSLQAAATAASQQHQAQAVMEAGCSLPGGAQATTSATAAPGVQPQPPQQQQQHLAQVSQSQHSQHTLQRATSQELMDAVDSMDVALLLDTFGAPLDQLQGQGQDNNRGKQKAEAHNQQLQPQQQHVQDHLLAFQQQQQRQQQQLQAAELQSQIGGLCSTSLPSAVAAAAAALHNPLSMSPGWAPLAQSVQAQQQQQQQQQALLQQQQQQQQLLQEQLQRQAQLNAAAAAAGCSLGPPSGFGVPSSEPVAVPAPQRQQQQQQQAAMRTLSGLSCLSQSGLSGSNTDCQQQMGSARSSNTMLLQTLEQQFATMSGACAGIPMTLAQAAGGGVAAAAAAAAGCGWPPSLEATQRQLQQLQQQQQVALQYLQQKQQEQQQVAAALAAVQQHQQAQAQTIQMLQRSMTDDLPRTSPITIGSGAATANALAAATSRRDAALRAGLGLSDPGIGLGRGARSLAQSPMSLQPNAAAAAALGASSTCLTDNLSGIAMDPSSIAAAAGPAATGAAGASHLPAAAPPPLASMRSLDAAASSFGALPIAAAAGSGGSTSVSPTNCNTLAGAVAERHVPLSAQQQQLMAQQMVLPGSAPPALGLAAALGSVGGGASSFDLQQQQHHHLGGESLMRVGSDCYDAVMAAAANASMLGGSLGMLGLGAGCGGDAVDAASLLARAERPMDPGRVAQLNRYKQKRMLRMRALAEGAKKVRYECRKQLADTRPRVRGRFAKVNSSDALLEYGNSGGGPTSSCMPASSSGGNGPTASAATGSACTAPPGVNYPHHSHHQAPGGWGLQGHHSQPHMQRIDEEAASEGQSPFMTQSTASLPLRQASSSGLDTDAGAGAGRQGGAAADAAAFGARVVGSAPAGLLGLELGSGNITATTKTAAVACGGGGGGAEQAQAQGLTPGGTATAPDCIITEHDLAALGFDDLTQLSGGFSNAGGNSNEDMDESAESMNDGSTAGPGAARPAPQLSSGQVVLQQQQQQVGGQASAMLLQPSTSISPTAQLQQQQQPTQQPLRSAQQAFMAPQPGPSAAAACGSMQPQQQQQLHSQQQQQQRLSVLDRPIMYGTDRSQFSAAQLSLLDSILTDQYRPSGPGGRH
ncbi:hypothetical protein PLESTF_000041100 [Pleodorina starrii]|nr:hypothetical protein PLESTF_000041100 [Pleodorina starrii]